MFSGLNWFKRVYVTSTSWENTQEITYQDGADGDYFHVDGTSKLSLFHQHYLILILILILLGIIFATKFLKMGQD